MLRVKPCVSAEVELLVSPNYACTFLCDIYSGEERPRVRAVCQLEGRRGYTRP